MKITVYLFLIVLFVGSSGCMTGAVLDKADSPRTYEDDNRKAIVDQQPRLAYYSLLPLSVPADIATSPIQAIYYGVLLHAMFELPSH